MTASTHPEVYELVFASWESRDSYLFFGPPGFTKSDWPLLLARLVDRATEVAIEKAKPLDEQDAGLWVGWGDIVQEIAELLPGHGFQPINPISNFFNGEDIIGLDDDYEPLLASGPYAEAMKKAQEHNKKVVAGLSTTGS